MDENTQFGTTPEIAENPTINADAVPVNPANTDAAQNAILPTKEVAEPYDCPDNTSDVDSTAPSPEPVTANTHPQPTSIPTDEANSAFEKVERDIAESDATNKKIFNELYEIRRLYHNEFASRLKSMQDELDAYHKPDRGTVFDGILSSLSRIYVNNETLVDEIDDPKTKKHVKYMLLDILDLLEEYGVKQLKSYPGDKRNIRHCQVMSRIPTDNQDLHDTIVTSHNSGFYKENKTIIKEMVDIYLYERPATPESPAVPATQEYAALANDAENITNESNN